MDYPLIENQPSHFPADTNCPVCGKARVWEPHTFVSIDTGACLMDRKEDSGEPSDDLDGFFHISFHGAHDDGEGSHREISTGLTIAAGARGGQLGMAVCSTACLRLFFNQWVDDLEEAITHAAERS